jgi:hypothetical protein
VKLLRLARLNPRSLSLLRLKLLMLAHRRGRVVAAPKQRDHPASDFRELTSTVRPRLTTGFRELDNRSAVTAVHCRSNARPYRIARRFDRIVGKMCIARRCHGLGVTEHLADDD